MASIIIVICLTVAIDKWLLKKQNLRVINILKKFGERLVLEYWNLIKKLEDKIKILDKEKKSLIEYTERLRKVNKKLKKKKS